MESWVGWLVGGGLGGAALGVIGVRLAAAWAWYRNQRKELQSEEDEREKKKREEEEREEAKRSMPYRLLFEQSEARHQQTLQELRADIATGQAGFRQLQAEHTDCKVTLASATERIHSLESDVAELREQLGQPRRPRESQQPGVQS
jgi:chromosome segregation ATPase